MTWEQAGASVGISRARAYQIATHAGETRKPYACVCERCGHSFRRWPWSAGRFCSRACFAPEAPPEIVSYPSAATIIAAVSDCTGITPAAIRGSGRNAAGARQIAMYLTCRMTTLTLPQIGRAFSRHHTTVLHARVEVPKRMEADPKLAAMVERAMLRVADLEDGR
jgi:hypothetical protein